MNRFVFSVILMAGFFVSCNNNINGPEQPLSGEFLEKDHTIRARIESSPPSGTIYSDGATVNTAVGSEALRADYWVDNIYGSSYEIDLYNATIIGLKNRAYITIKNPVSTRWRRTNSPWYMVTSTTTVFADSVKTSALGTCSTETDEEITIGTGGTQTDGFDS